MKTVTSTNNCIHIYMPELRDRLLFLIKVTLNAFELPSKSLLRTFSAFYFSHFLHLFLLFLLLKFKLKIQTPENMLQILQCWLLEVSLCLRARLWICVCVWLQLIFAFRAKLWLAVASLTSETRKFCNSSHRHR